MAEVNQNNPKISDIEALILLSYVGFTDLIGIVLVLFALDDFFILDILTFPVTQIYFRIMKKISKVEYDLAANLAELVPYLGALPLRTIGVAMVIWTDRHPKSIVSKLADKTSKMAGSKIKKPL